MRSKRHRLAFIAAGIAVALALTGAALAAMSGHAAASAGTVIKVTEREYHFTLSNTKPAAGKVTFVVHNAGHITHQFDVSGGGLKATAKAGSIAPGKTRTLTVSLKSGKVSIWCPIPGHAALGLKASLSVKGSTGTSSGGSTGGTTTTGGSTWG